MKKAREYIPGISPINARNVKDSNKNATIPVSKKDSEEGLRKTCLDCPASKAATRSFGCIESRIYRTIAYLGFKNHHGKNRSLEPDKWIRYMVSGPLKTEIIAQDRGGTFAPGNYLLKRVSKNEKNRRGKAHTARPSKHERPYKTKRSVFIPGLRDCPSIFSRGSN